MQDYTYDFLTEVFAPGDIVELRTMLKDGTIVAGRFTDLNKMAAIAHEIDSDWSEASAVYFCLNPIDPAAAERIGDFRANSVRSKVRTTRDRDVCQRTLYLLDFDPVRPSGVCSTELEKKAPYVCMLRVRDYLRSEAWPEPIVVDSGNGYHCYFKGDRCAPASSEWVRVLHYLSATFSNEAVKVDTSVGNAARVSRLPGTMNRKGADTPDRPHRRSMVVEYPEKWEALDHGKIYRLASRAGLIPRSGVIVPAYADMPELAEDAEERLQEFFDDYADYLDVAGQYEKEGVKYYALRECPFAGHAHTGNLGKTCITLSDTAVGFSCFSDDCYEYTFADLRRHLEKISGYKSEVTFYEQTTDAEVIELAEWMYDTTAEEMLSIGPIVDPDAPLSVEQLLKLLEDGQ